MSDSRRDPQPGDLLIAGEQMIACTSREGNLVSYILRMANGAEIAGMCTTDRWFEIVQDATPSGTVEVKKRIFEGA